MDITLKRLKKRASPLDDIGTPACYKIWDPVMETESPVLRAITESGEKWDDPSEDLLFILLEDIRDKHELFVIVERTRDTFGQTFIQAIRTGDSKFRLEYRDGSADRHFFAVTPDMRKAHDVLTKWSFELPGWDTAVEWQRFKLPG